MAKLFTRASVAGASLAGANLKATLTALWDALNSSGLSDSARSTITTSATLATTQCGLLLVDATSANIVLTLPTSGSATDDAIYTIRRIDASSNSVTVQRGGTDTIEGGTSSVLIPPGGTTELQMPGGATNWRVLMISGGSAANARNAIGAAGSSRVSGLVGAVNATTPLTKYDLQALAVTLRDANGALATQLNTATITCDLGLAGPAANGRDVLAAFTASQWVYLYFIWNGTTLATLASATAPSAFTGATLPAGYTHWAFATALRWNASSNLIPTRTLGKTVWYQLDNNGAANRALAAGTATAFNSVNLASLIPPNALLADLLTIVSGTHNIPGANFTALLRPTGSGLTFGINAADINCQVSGVAIETSSRCLIPPGTASQIDYKLSVASATMGVYIDVAAYTIPNGGE